MTGFWKNVKWSRPTAVFGFGMGDVELPPVVEVDTKRLWAAFHSGVHTNWEMYTGVINTPNLNKLEEVAGLPQEGFEFPTGLWAKVLCTISP